MAYRRWIDGSAVALAIAALAIGILTPLVGHFDLGLRLATVDGRVKVTDVNAYSPAARYGFVPGMVAISLDGRQLIRLPEYVYPAAQPTPDPVSGEVPQPVPIGIDPPVPTPVSIEPGDLAALAAAPITEIAAVRASDLAAWQPDGGGIVSIGDDGWNSLRESIIAVIVGLIVFFATAWWLRTGRAGRSLQEMAYPVAVAFSAAFLFRPLVATFSPVGVALFSVLVPVSLLPLAAALSLRIEAVEERRLAVVGAAACAVGAAAVGLARLAGPAVAEQALPIGILAGGVTALPGIMAAGPRRPGAMLAPAPGGEAVASGRLLRLAELAVVGVTPFFAMTTVIGPFVFPFFAWVAAVVVAGRLTVRPLARLAGRAQLQRDLIVAATEAERARVAADIHDDALQELTLLVRRLDAAGDSEGADIARGVSERLRAICGDLRLPILDDLGIGPALDWLVLRIEKLAGARSVSSAPTERGHRPRWNSPSSALPRRPCRTPSSTAGRRSPSVIGPPTGWPPSRSTTPAAASRQMPESVRRARATSGC